MTSERIHAPAGGTITAVAITGSTAYAAGPAGVARCSTFGGRAGDTWQRLTDAPPGVLCLAVSPDVARDCLLVAGDESGLSVSHDGGDTWRAAALPGVQPLVLCAALSPAFAIDGIVLAGTRDDGILMSSDRGAHWHSANFGMLDSTVLSLAFSPRFGEDQTVYAAADGDLYFSYNGARAWKPLPFPDEAGVALSLCALAQADGVVLYAGTEQAGVWRSRDEGARWERLPTEFGCVNALACDGADVIAATESGVWRLSADSEIVQALAAEQTLSVAAADGALLAGAAEAGAWWRPQRGRSWQAVRLPPMRALTRLSAPADGAALYAYGAREGAWRYTSGRTMRSGASDFGVDVHALQCAPGDVVLAAGDAGLWRSADAGATWRQCDDVPTRDLALAPGGRHLARLGVDGLIAVSADVGDSWQTVAGPWQTGGAAVRAIAIADDGSLCVAARSGLDDALLVWRAHASTFHEVLRQPTAGAQPVALWQAPGAFEHAPCHVAAHHTIWRCAAAHGSPLAELPADAGAIVALSGRVADGVLTLAACTGRALYVSHDGASWSLRQAFDAERALAVAVRVVRGKPRTDVLMLGGAVRQV